jgi:hypothetical protein
MISVRNVVLRQLRFQCLNSSPMMIKPRKFRLQSTKRAIRRNKRQMRRLRKKNSLLT